MEHFQPGQEGLGIQAAPLAPPDRISLRIGPAQVWLILLLMLASALSFADKSILQILVDPIKGTIHIDDVQASLLMGVSFTVLYALAAVPFGILSDRVDRRKMIAPLLGSYICQ